MGRTMTRKNPGKKLQLPPSPRAAVGPTTSTPAVSSTRRKRPAMLSPGLSPLKLRSEIKESTILKPASQEVQPNSRSDSDDFFSGDTSQDSCPSGGSNTHATDARTTSAAGSNAITSSYSWSPPKHRRRRRHEPTISAAADALRDKVKHHFKEVEEFQLEFD